jgi:hypothetical protein
MKTRYILLSFLALSITVFAALPPRYDVSSPPSLPLPAAYQLAVAALGSVTNQFHCVSAIVSEEFGTPGWDFTFCSTNKPARYEYVTVEFTGETHRGIAQH